MKISMKEHGGWGALLNRLPKLVDTDMLPAEAAAEGKRLVAAMLAAAPAAGADSSRAPEAMTYSFTIEGDGETRTCKLSDAALGPHGAALLEWFLKHVGR
jgi:hypothetical protein